MIGMPRYRGETFNFVRFRITSADISDMITIVALIKGLTYAMVLSVGSRYTTCIWVDVVSLESQCTKLHPRKACYSPQEHLLGGPFYMDGGHHQPPVIPPLYSNLLLTIVCDICQPNKQHVR